MKLGEFNDDICNRLDPEIAMVTERTYNLCSVRRLLVNANVVTS
jgi:hypothetical protein